MLVEDAGDHVRDEGTPLLGAAHRHQVFLQEFENRAKVELRVFQEAQQQFHRAVAGTAAQAEHGGVDAVGALDDGLDGVGKRQLHVVVRVDADLLADRVSHGDVFDDQFPNLLVVECPVAVHHDDGVHWRLSQRVQCLVDLGVGDRADGHDVAGCLVAFVVGVLDHVHRGRNLMRVSGDADAVEHALLGRQDVGLVVGLAGVGHGGELERTVVVADDPAQIILVAVFPVAVLLPGKLRLGGFVAQFHVVDTGLDGGVVDSLDEVILKKVVVDKAPVADGAVQNLDLRAERHPRGVFFGFTHFSTIAKESKSLEAQALGFSANWFPGEKGGKCLKNRGKCEALKRFFLLFRR